MLLINIGQLLTLCQANDHRGPRRGRDLKELGLIEDAAVLCQEGKVVFVGKSRDVLRDSRLKKRLRQAIEIDCKSQVVLPGFVDSHTHPAFIRPRLTDFERRISGASYEEIAQAGGGIRSSVEAVRKASRSELGEIILAAFKQMNEQGTTTLEAKSGYGLTVESELKSLRAIRDAAASWPGTVVSTLLGAHTVPREFQGHCSSYVDLVCHEMIPQAARRKLVQFVDVFTDRGAFSVRDTETIFQAAAASGLGVRAHVCQLSEIALEPLLRFDPASLDHLDHVRDHDIAKLARGNTVATLVPGANYFLGLDKFPPARKLIDAGVPVALATDYNPGSSPTPSMPFVLSLACTQMRMLPAEAIAAATINGAWALRLEKRKGSIAAGKDADLAVFEVEDYRELPYWFASSRCALTILKGLVMANAGSAEVE
ncbi:MAG TPA: imidazolonepropionase [Terriglobales bacterium]|nr:imidazolonepropionase [Terriglobales bacterium]